MLASSFILALRRYVNKKASLVNLRRRRKDITVFRYRNVRCISHPSVPLGQPLKGNALFFI